MTPSALEDWIKQLLARPVDELNSRYDYSPEDVARHEVESLADVEPRKFASTRVSAHTLQELHRKIRAQECESIVWDALIFYLLEPLPPDIAHDLISRDIIVSQLGHTRQNDEVQWRLASLVDEAFLTFVWDMFTKPIYSASEFEKLLGQHPEHLWLLEKWEHWALLSSEVREMD